MSQRKDNYKIVLFDNFADNNLGDRLYPVTFMEIFKRFGGEFSFSLLDIHGRSVCFEDLENINDETDIAETSDSNRIVKKLYKAMYPLSREAVWNLKKAPRLRKIYNESLKDADAIIIPGGGIIEATYFHYFYHHLDIMTRIADKRHIPVYFSSVGLVKDSKHMFGWKTMKKVLNRECVRSITCRDGVEWINNNMFDGREVAKLLACSALCADEVYDISKQADTYKIGIGVIRGNAFSAYSQPINKKELIDIYENTIRILLEKGYECEIYHNGGAMDEDVAQELFERFHDHRVTKAIRPRCVKDLIDTISGFKGVITARLHSLYIAYSLQIPAVGLCYTNKHVDFMKMIGNDAFAVKPEELFPEHIVDMLKSAIDVGYNYQTYTIIKKQVSDGIKKVHDDILEWSLAQ